MQVTGPHQIIDAVSDNVCLIQNPMDKCFKVHASRFWFFSNEKYFKTTDIQAIFKDSVKCLDVKEVLEYKVDKGDLKFSSDGDVFKERFCVGT